MSKTITSKGKVISNENYENYENYKNENILTLCCNNVDSNMIRLIKDNINNMICICFKNVSFDEKELIELCNVLERSNVEILSFAYSRCLEQISHISLPKIRNIIINCSLTVDQINLLGNLEGVGLRDNIQSKYELVLLIKSSKITTLYFKMIDSYESILLKLIQETDLVELSIDTGFMFEGIDKCNVLNALAVNNTIKRFYIKCDVCLLDYDREEDLSEALCGLVSRNYTLNILEIGGLVHIDEDVRVAEAMVNNFTLTKMNFMHRTPEVIEILKY